ncbi:Estradiol 17-beta-dehydrogenase 2 [Portunus trituberculatus]|uniref:Estradiol 17-beta-dehydrogenase 2 n=1 Tax=Portunus trituberculatus TaxID=210409 RepID=A0A5B7IZC8_PORTR|nr:Estradiol 17-beta-dehydrogenase 2 [Portunus trituberculatus]
MVLKGLRGETLGFRVFAGCLDVNGEGAATLKRHGSSRLVVLQMDVTNQDQLVKAAQEVKKQLPSGGEVVLCCF